MHAAASLLLFIIPLVVACGAILYHLAVTAAALRFRFQPEPDTGCTPPVSILKPVRGMERNFYATLAGYFQQDYPAYEIVFGLDDAKDPAHWTIAQLRHDFPNLPVKVVVVGEHRPGHSPTNPKIEKLQHMVAAAAHDVLVISDADIRVGRDYLRRVVAPLADERVGMVTCLYRAGALRTWNSLSEALGISAGFAGQVLLAHMLGGIRFGLGATMATRKQQIERIGGLAPWSDYLADDYILGNRIAAAGYEVKLSHRVVETVLPPRTAAETLQQQLRWARTLRACSPRGYPGLVFAFGAPLALVALAWQPHSALALAVVCCVLIARWSAAWSAGVAVLGDPLVKSYFWLLPLHDLLSLLIWAASFAGKEVVWRQNRFRLEADGRIRPVH